MQVKKYRLFIIFINTFSNFRDDFPTTQNSLINKNLTHDPNTYNLNILFSK